MTMSEVTDNEEASLRNANEIDRRKIWAEWVDKFGPSEASRRWLVIFGANDASETG